MSLLHIIGSSHQIQYILDQLGCSTGWTTGSMLTTCLESRNAWTRLAVNAMFGGIHGGQGVGGEGGSTAGFMKNKSSGVHGVNRIGVLCVVRSHEGKDFGEVHGEGIVAGG